jgi:tRNA pseudouridine55 synthase
VLAIDKPSGWTSYDVVAVMRRAVAVRRVGHGGTLDPAATGLLPVLVGTATRFAERLHTAPKVYAALVRFGMETTTDDRDGTVRREAPVPLLDAREIDQALDPFRGDIQQVPPDFAAVKVDGRRAYDVARSGGSMRLGPRLVHVERCEIASWRPPSLRLLIVCGSGTYIRSLARDLGRAVGSAAHLGALRRLAVGALTVDEALDVGTARAEERAAIVARLRPADDGLLGIPGHYLTASAADVLGGWEAA